MLIAEKSYFKKSLEIAWPAVLEFLFISIAGMIDTFMVSSMGPSAISAIGLVTQPKFIAFIGILQLMNTGYLVVLLSLAL